MKTKLITGIAMTALVFGLILSPTLASNHADASVFKQDYFLEKGFLTAPSGDKSYGSNSVGKYQIDVSDDQLRIFVNLFTTYGTNLIQMIPQSIP